MGEAGATVGWKTPGEITENSGQRPQHLCPPGAAGEAGWEAGVGRLENLTKELARSTSRAWISQAPGPHYSWTTSGKSLNLSRWRRKNCWGLGRDPGNRSSRPRPTLNPGASI